MGIANKAYIIKTNLTVSMGKVFDKRNDRYAIM
jgi:hypothetical protein